MVRKADGFPKMLALPIVPARLQASIVGRSELNCCVRNGNRWTLTLISTNSFNLRERLPCSKHYLFLPQHCVPSIELSTLLIVALQKRFVNRFLKFVVTRTGFEPMLMA